MQGNQALIAYSSSLNWFAIVFQINDRLQGGIMSGPEVMAFVCKPIKYTKRDDQGRRQNKRRRYTRIAEIQKGEYA